MTNSRSKGSLLSETAKAYIREMWIKEIFEREKYDLKNKFFDKGNACESDSLDLVQKVTGKTYFKNRKELANEFITGTPDLILDDKIIDIKTSWDIWTYAGVDEDSARKNYYYQLMGYMWLTEKTSSDLIYCLVDTPENIIQDELYKLSFRYPEINESEEKASVFKKNYLFGDIDIKLRMKQYSFTLSDEDIEAVKERIIAAREYMATLSL